MGLTPAFSSPAVCSGIFHSCIFHPWNYARAAFSTPVFSVAPTEIWAVWRPQVERKKVWRFLTQQFNCCTCAARCAGALSCWNKVGTRRVALSCGPVRALLRTHGLEYTLVQRCAHGSAPVGALPWAQHALCASD